LLLPSAIQLVHTFENHEHNVCTAVDVNHIHEQEIDCDLLHRLLQTPTINFTNNYAVIPQHFYAKTPLVSSQQITFTFASEKTSRGPPFFIV